MMKKISLVVAILLLANFVDRGTAVPLPFWAALPQSTPVYRGRADPIRSPGAIADHVNKVFGGSGFSLGGGKSEDLYDELLASSCTTSSFTIDNSAYYVTDLYWQDPETELLHLVPTSLFTAYYIGRNGLTQPNPDFVAYPRGFQMSAGDSTRRNYTNTVPEQALSYACLTAGPGGAETPFFPSDQFCANGLRLQIFFPSCWDGVHVDSADGSHVAYPVEYNTGDCPSTHPVHIPSVFYEVLYDVSAFPHGDGTQPFRLSNGDATGRGLQGTFVSGWPVDILQSVLEDPSCLDNSTTGCNTLRPFVKPLNLEGTCTLDRPIPNYEDLGVNKPIAHLPGCNPITFGPKPALPCCCDSPQPAVGSITRVLIKSLSNGKFVSSLSPLINLKANVDKEDLGYPQVFDLKHEVGTDLYSLQTETFRLFVSANNRDETPIIANRATPSDWEFWGIRFLAGEEKPFPSFEGSLATIVSYSNNKFVQVKANGDLQANSPATLTTLTVKEVYAIYDANAFPQCD